MPDLERELLDLATHLDAPARPGPAATAAAELRRRRAAAVVPPARPARLRRVAVAAATLAAVVTAGVGLSPAVADLLGLRGVRITRDDRAGLPTRLGGTLALGVPVRLADARRQVPFRILLPARDAVGDPDEVYLDESLGDPHVALVWRDRPGLPETATTGVGLLLTEFRGDLGAGQFEKVLGRRTRMERLTVNGGRALWLEGAPHGFFYRDADGEVRDQWVRLAGNVLLWEQDGITLRLESALSRAEAVRIAGTVR